MYDDNTMNIIDISDYTSLLERRKNKLEKFSAAAWLSFTDNFLVTKKVFTREQSVKFEWSFKFNMDHSNDGILARVYAN